MKGFQARLDPVSELLRTPQGNYPFPCRWGAPEPKVSLVGLGLSAHAFTSPHTTFVDPALQQGLSSGQQRTCAPPRPLLQAPGQEVSDLGHSWHSNPPRIPAGAKSLVSGEMTSELWTWLAGHCLGQRSPGGGTCHKLESFISLPLPPDLPRKEAEVLEEKDRLPGQGKALTFQSPFCECQLPRRLKTAFPWGKGRKERPAWGRWGSGSPLPRIYHYPPTGVTTAVRAAFQVESFSRTSTSFFLSYLPPHPAPCQYRGVDYSMS